MTPLQQENMPGTKNKRGNKNKGNRAKMSTSAQVYFRKTFMSRCGQKTYQRFVTCEVHNDLAVFVLLTPPSLFFHLCCEWKQTKTGNRRMDSVINEKEVERGRAKCLCQW